VLVYQVARNERFFHRVRHKAFLALATCRLSVEQRTAKFVEYLQRRCCVSTDDRLIPMGALVTLPQRAWLPQ
jgi:hypothetical protein